MAWVHSNEIIIVCCNRHLCIQTGHCTCCACAAAWVQTELDAFECSTIDAALSLSGGLAAQGLEPKQQCVPMCTVNT